LRNSSFFPEQSLFVRLNSRNIILVLFFEIFPSLCSSFHFQKICIYIFPFTSLKKKKKQRDRGNDFPFTSFSCIFLLPTFFPLPHIIREKKNIKLDVQKTQHKSKRIRTFINYKKKKRRIRDHGAN